MAFQGFETLTNRVKHGFTLSEQDLNLKYVMIELSLQLIFDF